MTRRKSDLEHPVESDAGKAREQRADGAYRVGYGRPPRSSQFKPGETGNPSGRPKGRKSLSSQVREEMTTTITVQEGQKRRKVPKIAGVVLRQIQSALKGNDRSAMAVIQMARQLGVLHAMPPEPPEQAPLSPADEAIIAKLLNGRGPKDE
jgi:hypothetical protein